MTAIDGEVRYNFSFVQRIQRGHSYRFELEYMGSIEFETSKGSQSLRRMQSDKPFELREVDVTRVGRTKPVYFIAPRLRFDDKLFDFMTWVAKERLRGQEETHFDKLFDEKYFPWWGADGIRTVAWWSLDDDILWTLDCEVAEQLLYGLECPETD